MRSAIAAELMLHETGNTDHNIVLLINRPIGSIYAWAYVTTTSLYC